MKSTKAIALRVSNLLALKGMSRYSLCKKIAMSEMTLKHIIHADYKSIRFDTLVLIAEGFDMSIQEFLNDELFSRDNLEID